MLVQMCTWSPQFISLRIRLQRPSRPTKDRMVGLEGHKQYNLSISSNNSIPSHINIHSKTLRRGITQLVYADEPQYTPVLPVFSWHILCCEHMPGIYSYIESYTKISSIYPLRTFNFMSDNVVTIPSRCVDS